MSAHIAVAVLLVLSGGAAAAPLPMNETLTQGSAAGPLTADQLKVLDDTLGKIETIVLDVESMAEGGVDGTGCPPTFSVRDFMQDLKAKRLAQQTGNEIPEADAGGKSAEKADWQLYFVCQALAVRNPAACAEAAAVTPRQSKSSPATNGTVELNFSFDNECVKTYHRERARAGYLSRSPNFLDLCREAAPHLVEFKSAAAVDATCRAWRDDSGGDHGGFVAAIQAGVRRPIERAAALQAAREMTVEAGACEKIPDALGRRTCREQEDFLKAFKAKNAGACSGGLCRVLMGGPLAACEPYAKKFKSAACSEAYAADFVASSGKTVNSDFDQIEGLLASPSVEGGDLEALKAFNARLDKLYALRARFDKAAAKIAPTTRKGG